MNTIGPVANDNVVKALIFDMDGLLVDSEPLARNAMEAFLAGHGLQLRQEIQRQLLGRRLPEAVAIVKDGYGLPQPVEVLTAEYAAMRLDAIRGNLVTMPGVEALFAFGKAHHLPMALATSAMREHANVSLAEANLAGRFDAEVTGDEVHRGKPAPDLFLLAAERLGVDPAACVVFEDAPNGIAAARAAGMRAAAVPNDQNRQHPFTVAPDVFLQDLDAAIPWLQGLGLGDGIPE